MIEQLNITDDFWMMNDKMIQFFIFKYLTYLIFFFFFVISDNTYDWENSDVSI